LRRKSRVWSKASSPKSVKPPVIIIGGGISGLAAAARLLRQGVPIRLLEAKRRLGGRIHTIYHDSFPIELGAEFIHGQNKALLAAIQEAGLRTRSVSDRHRVIVDAKPKQVDFFPVVEKILQAVLQGRDLSFQQLIDREGLDDLRRQLALDYVEGFNAAHADRISAHALSRAQHAADRMQGSWQGRLTRGYGALVNSLRKQTLEMGGLISHSAEVNAVKWKHGCVEVGFIHHGRRKTETSAAIIMTLPIGIWKAGRVVFTPTLAEKQQVTQELEFGNVAKINLCFSHKWWPKTATGFLHSPGEPLPTWWTGARGAILTGWAGGPKADALSKVSAKKLTALCLDSLSKLFCVPKTRIKSGLAAVYTHDWSRDPHMLGAYSYLPVNGLDLPKTLATPIQDTLFFAGEATVFDAQTGTVFGALESGLRAAGELLACLKMSWPSYNETQQIRGNCSPESISTTRIPPTRVDSSHAAGFCNDPQQPSRTRRLPTSSWPGKAS
jgi:monoamine oxidase